MGTPSWRTAIFIYSQPYSRGHMHAKGRIEDSWEDRSKFGRTAYNREDSGPVDIVVLVAFLNRTACYCRAADIATRLLTLWLKCRRRGHKNRISPSSIRLQATRATFGRSIRATCPHGCEPKICEPKIPHRRVIRQGHCNLGACPAKNGPISVLNNKKGSRTISFERSFRTSSRAQELEKFNM